ncbi:MAG: HAMP domain-containing sensor histidine kinase [Candidatus Stygibacter australis]|nr:HAMP domain-containing sensor histidine kinase [Candidatus Stygibacter australis]MDP8322987.1 HAMP domain-containing sensor histidine kinase [Candidatus Stygibacter australis]
MKNTPKEITEILNKLINICNENQTNDRTKQKEKIKSLVEQLQEEIIKTRKRDAILTSQSLQVSMEQMIGFMAHQWKQPLNAVNIIVQNLEDAYKFEELDQELITRSTIDVMEQVNFMSHSIDDFRRIYLQGKEKKLIAVDDILSRAADLAKRSYSSLNINIILDLQADCLVWGYVNEIFQVILNILSNIKNAFLNSSIPNDKRFVKISSSSENGQCQIVISDSAGKMAETVMEKLFEPEEQGQDKIKTVGLGLFMTKLIITDSFKGTISAFNDDNGTTFSIMIPEGKEACC